MCCMLLYSNSLTTHGSKIKIRIKNFTLTKKSTGWIGWVVWLFDVIMHYMTHVLLLLGKNLDLVITLEE